MARHTSDSEAPHVDAGPASRLGTILPMVSWALQAVIITLTVLTALGNLGINVTPLLAGAGVAGLAIGFGAQKLVSDMMSGLFFLIDDAFRLNEYIDTGGKQGTVEKISLRSIQLRDAKGPVLIIPYSNIKTVTNFGRDWGIMKLKFTVPFDTDIEKVRKIFKKIGAGDDGRSRHSPPASSSRSRARAWASSPNTASSCAASSCTSRARSSASASTSSSACRKSSRPTASNSPGAK